MGGRQLITMAQSIPMSEVRKHSTPDDCWVVIHEKVYDLTDFLSEHPGGKKVILRYAGKDATPGFDPIHPRDIIQKTMGANPANCIGNIDKQTMTADDSKSLEEEPPKSVAAGTLPSIDRMLNLFDFEAVAKAKMKKGGWDYYSSGADDEITLRENHLAFQRLWLKPRILRNVANIDFTTSFLGEKSSMPLYITATALGKLAHPDGELAITRAAHAAGVPYMLPTLSSYSLDEMIGEKAPSQVCFVQLYVNSDRKVTEEYLQRAEAGGCKAVFVTVDAPQLGRREKDMRNKFADETTNVQDKGKVNKNQGTARMISAFIDPSLSWKDVAWLRSITKMKVVLKGVQTAEDALLAVEHGVDGILLSNHGGRQMDTARSAIEVLVEVMDALRARGVTDKVEVFVDGGIRRATDIFKAVALGAKAVGIGRPTLYSLAAYGQEGVERMLQLLKEELTMAMRLMGAPTIAEIVPGMVQTRNISDHFVMQAPDNLMSSTYEPMA